MTIELDLGADARRVVKEVKSYVDAITTFLLETEKPIVHELTNRLRVVDIAVSGDMHPFTLKEVTERVGEQLTAIPGITQGDIVSAHPYESWIEVSENDLHTRAADDLRVSGGAAALRRAATDHHERHPVRAHGAVWGHVLLGLNVSIMSMFGLVALTGVVVNDSLSMVDFINRARGVHADVGRLARQAAGVPTDRRDFETAGLALSVREAGVHRFRPILLTSLTTSFDLAPLMWNRSLAPSFMGPMAVSLGFGCCSRR